MRTANCCRAVFVSLLDPGLHAECAWERDRPAEDHGQGSREAAAQGRVHRGPDRESQNQRADQGPQRPAAGHRKHRYMSPLVTRLKASGSVALV